jgi:hypothetical protein
MGSGACPGSGGNVVVMGKAVAALAYQLFTGRFQSFAYL